MNIADGFHEVRAAAVRGARPAPELLVDRWSKDYMVLPANSKTPGKYRVEHTPYARRVLRVLSPGYPCKRVVARVASQMFKTQTAINWMLASIHQQPANVLALEPNDTLAKRLSARIKRSVADVEEVKKVVAAPRSRDSRNTMDTMEFKGGALHVLTSGSAANLAEISVRYLYIDEVDRMAASVDGEGDPSEIAEARTTRFDANCKIYYTSSPTEKGFSKIDALHDQGTQEAYHVPCPHCGHLHELVLANFHFQRDEKTGYMARAWFTCPDCGADIDEHHKSEMLKDEEMGGQARWVAASKGDGETISFSMNAFYASVGTISWVTLARQYARALDQLVAGNPNPMRVFYNTRLALSFEDTVHSTTASQLMERGGMEKYRLRVVPEAALVLTMAVDTQPDRLELSIEAWGPGMEHWVMDYIVLPGPATDPPTRAGSVWQRLDAVRRTALVHESGVPIYISAYAIDSGGHNTQDVYNYGAARERMGCVIIKGHSRPNKPIVSSVPTKVDVNWHGEREEGGARLWMIGTDTAKDWLYQRMKLVDGPGAHHMHVGLGEHWFNGMVAERPRRRQDKKGRVVVDWVKDPNARNEPFDLSVYNLAIAHKLGLHKRAQQEWDALRSRLIPLERTGDLFTAPELLQPEAAPAPAAPAMPAAAAAVPVAQAMPPAPPPMVLLEHAGATVAPEPETQAPAGVTPMAVAVTARPVSETTGPGSGAAPAGDVEAQAPGQAGANVCTDAAPEVPASPFPLYPMNHHMARRRRIRSRGI